MKMSIFILSVLFAITANATPLGVRLAYYAALNNADADPTLYWVDGESIIWNVQGVPAPTEQTLPDGGAAEAWLAGRQVQPVDFPNGIAIPSLTNGNYYTITPTDDGNVVVVEAHASPYDPEAHQARIQAALQKKQSDKAAAQAVKDSPNLAARVEALERLLGIRE